jgi:hypothetical protein
MQSGSGHGDQQTSGSYYRGRPPTLTLLALIHSWFGDGRTSEHTTPRRAEPATVRDAVVGDELHVRRRSVRRAGKDALKELLNKLFN